MLFKSTILPIAIIFIFTSLSTSTLAQKCSYEKNEIDGLLEVAIKRTSPQKLCRIENQPLYIKAQCIGENKYLKIRYYEYEGFTFQPDREIGFVLPSNDEITLFPRPMPVDSSQVDAITEITKMVVYKLSTDQYQTLKNVPIIKFKYYITSGFLEKEIKAASQRSVMDILRCVE